MLLATGVQQPMLQCDLSISYVVWLSTVSFPMKDFGVAVVVVSTKPSGLYLLHGARSTSFFYLPQPLPDFEATT